MTRPRFPLMGVRLLAGVAVALLLAGAWAGLSRVPGIWIFAGSAVLVLALTVGWVAYRVREDLRTDEGRAGVIAEITGMLWTTPQVATFLIVAASLEKTGPRVFARFCLAALASAPVSLAAHWLRARAKTGRGSKLT